MKKLTLLILILCACTRLSCRAQSTLNQVLITDIPPAIDISVIESTPSGTINPETGENSVLYARFQIKSNASDDLYDFIIKAFVQSREGKQENALTFIDNSSYIVLGNVFGDNYPTIASINNAKNLIKNNPNAIAYQVTSSVTDFDRVEFENISNYGGNIFKIYLGDVQQGQVSTRVFRTPAINTYDFSEDKPGTYEAILTLTAFRKP